MNLHEGCATMTTFATGAKPSPAHLSFACVLNGVEPVALDKPFTYFEFGFGQDTALSQSAASAAHGRFYAADCTPRPPAGAAAATVDAGLPNLTLLTHSFAELAQGVAGLPQFDFIVARCDLDRIAPDCRRHVVAFIARHLEPGGIAYAGYNAMPGAATGHPLQRLVLEYEAQAAGSSPLAVQALADADALYFDTNPGVPALWDRLKQQPGERLSAMEPLYFADVARDFAAAKLDFVAPADARHPVAPPALTADQQDFLNDIDDMVLRETLKDFIRNTAYRADLFVRGPRRMHPVRHHQWLQRSGLALTNIRTGPPPVRTIPLLDALAERPLTLAELAQSRPFQDHDLAAVLDMAALAVASGQAIPFFTGKETR